MDDRDKELVYFYNYIIDNFAGQAIVTNGDTIEVLKPVNQKPINFEKD